MNGADYLKMAQHLGATKVLEKPFTNEVLMAAVDELLKDGTTEAAGDPRPNSVDGARCADRST